MVVTAALAAPGAADEVADPRDTALPCRPTIACTADIVPPGVFELEAGYTYRRLGDRTNQSTFPLLLKLTVVDWAQLQIGSNGPTFASGPSRAHYFDDVTIGPKFHLHDQTPSWPSLSVSAALNIPTAAARGYTRTYDALFTAYVTKDIGWLHADWNVGLNVWRIADSPRHQAWIALSLSVHLPRQLGADLEGYYFSDAAPISLRDSGILAAVTYSLRTWLVLDAGADAGLVRSTRTVSAFAGVTAIPARLWGPRTRTLDAARIRRDHEARADRTIRQW
ncbi:MAG TPA: transporter [Kofleriaceae bacterium]|nr:transporter [Kofleriaceae bacterium]